MNRSLEEERTGGKYTDTADDVVDDDDDARRLLTRVESFPCGGFNSMNLS